MLVSSFLHDGTIGDIWASLAAVREYYKKEGKKPTLYLTNGQAAIYYEGATHPTKNAQGINVMLNEEMINMMLPLLKVQPYLEDAKIHDNEPIGIDLNLIRHTFINMPNGMLSRWYFYVFWDLACNLSEEYIFVPDTDKDFAKGKIIVARTERYQNTTISYSFLKEYESSLVFAGTRKEYNLFCLNFDLDIPKLEIKDFLELAQALKQSKGLISNQTQIFQLAEGMKTPRIVELCQFAPNVVPIGDNAYDFYAQGALELYFHLLNGTEQEYRDSIVKQRENPTFISSEAEYRKSVKATQVLTSVTN